MIQKRHPQGLQKRPWLRDLAGDSLFFLLSKMIPAAVGVLAVAVYTRLLTREKYGLYTLVITTVSIVSLPLSGWLSQASLRFFEESNRKGELNAFISTITTSLAALVSLGCLVWYLGTLALGGHVEEELVSLMKLGGMVLALEAGYSVLLNILRAQRKTLHYALYTSSAAAGTFGIAILLIRFCSLGPSGILWAHAVVTGGLCLVGFIWVNRRWEATLAAFSPNLLRQLASYGLPLVVLSVGELILSVSDRYVIGYLLGPDDVGVYAAGYHIAAAGVSMFSLPLVLAGFPILIQAYEYQAEEMVAKLLRDLVGVYFVIMFPVVVIFAAFWYEIGRIVLGTAYIGGGAVLPWVATGVFFLVLTFIINQPFQLTKRTRLMLFPLALSALINIGMNIVLVPIAGILGAAVATLVAYSCYFLSALLVSRSIFTWPFPWQTLGKTALASIAMYVSLTILSEGSPSWQTMLVRIVVGTTIYAGVLMILKETLLHRALAYVKQMRLRVG